MAEIREPRLRPEPGDVANAALTAVFDFSPALAPATTNSSSDASSNSALLLAQPQKSKTAMRCCCGQTGCIYLEHNCSVLESVENDVRTAAKLGQSLLERHEAYMADAERDRAELILRIGQLEMDKKELEVENARKIEENRALLDQLETLNSTVSDSDTHIKMLEATLQSSQQIIRRLEGAAERAEDMERHLAALEAEQALLQNSLVTTESEARSAVQRWKRAERGITDLQYQLEKMEKEACEERERHLEIVDRMERQRAMEQQLNTAAGRLKGAAATKSIQQANNSNGVVTHFVRDLLQDNANLQMGMAELRQMLMNSNDEIQLLRDQLTYHQPLPETNASATSTLRAELETGGLSCSPEMGTEPDLPELPAMPTTPFTPQLKLHRSSSQEVHIHHHYHVNKKAEPKKLKKKRLSLTPGVFTPPATFPGTPLSQSRAPSLQYDPLSSSPMSDSASRHASQHMSRDSVSTAVSGPSNRWSVFSDQPSEFGMSSVPSSPQTNSRNSIFDRTVLSDLSLPVSPATSLDPLSPWQSGTRVAGLNDALVCGFPPPLRLPSAAESVQLPEPIAEDDETDVSVVRQDASHAEEDESEISNADDVSDFVSNDTGMADASASSEATTPLPTQDAQASKCDDLPQDNLPLAAEEEEPLYFPRRSLHRAVSHESIVSLQGGLDIHTLKARPSQLLMRPLGTATANIGISSITAQPVISRGTPDTSRSNMMLRDSLSFGLPAPKSTRVVSSPLTSLSTATSATARLAATSSLTGSRKFGMLVGWRPWGGGTSAPTVAKAQATTASAHVTAGSEALTGESAKAMAIPSATPSKPSTALSPAPSTPKRGNGDENSGDRSVVASTDAAAATVTVPDANVARTEDGAARTSDSGWTPDAKLIIRDRQGMRSPGINQPGAIPGFLEYWTAHQRRGAPSKVRPDTVDHEALQEVLEEH